MEHPAAAFSRSSDPSRIHLRTIAAERSSVCSMIALSEALAMAAAAASPDLRL